MNPFRMRGSWDPTSSRVYNWVVVPAMEVIYREQSALFLNEALARPGTLLLDVGCGTGHALGIIARQYPDLEMIGVDLSELMINEAKKKYAGRANLSFRRGDAMSLPFDPDSFDFVISMASIKHWPDQLKGLVEIRRVLKPGGGVLVMEADRNCSERAAANFVRHWRGVFWPGRPLVTAYFRRVVAGQGMDVSTLKRLFGEAGFEPNEVEALEQYPAVVARGAKPPRAGIDRSTGTR